MQWTQGDSNRAQPPLEGKAFSMPYRQQKSTLADASYSGPRGIRTPGLLNAIETRSQLRYGPGIMSLYLPSAPPIPRGGGCVRYGPGNFLVQSALLCKDHPVGACCLSIRRLPALDGPGGIRTLGLFSAIEARSQLRYRPAHEIGHKFS